MQIIANIPFSDAFILMNVMLNVERDGLYYDEQWYNNDPIDKCLEKHIRSFFSITVTL